MTKLALIHIETGNVISVHDEGSGHVDIPGVGRVSPPVAGWEGGGELITTEGPPRYRLVPVEPLEVPPGKRAVPGSQRIEPDGDSARVVAEIEDIPEPPSEEARVGMALRVLGFDSPEAFLDAVERTAAKERRS